MEPFSKTYAPGATLALRAHAKPEQRLMLWVDDQNGNVVGVPFRQDEQGLFTISQRLPDVPGHYYIAVTRDDHGERQPAYIVPIHVGVPEPSTADDSSVRSMTIPQNADEWQRGLLAILNQERSRIGLGALQLDAGLSDTARAIAAESESGKTMAWRQVAARVGEKAKHRIGESHIETLEDFGEAIKRNPYNRHFIRASDVASVGIGLVEQGKPDSEGPKTYRIQVILSGK
jgi:hypothetical protein